MISVFATFNENPIIRYYFPKKQADTPNTTTYSARLAKSIQDELDKYCTVNPEFPVCCFANARRQWTRPGLRQ
jgi:hypothetical protein